MLKATRPVRGRHRLRAPESACGVHFQPPLPWAVAARLVSCHLLQGPPGSVLPRAVPASGRREALPPGGAPPGEALTPATPLQESVAPLFEIHMQLDEAGLVFSPSLEVGSDRGFLALVDGLVNDIYNAAKLIPRLAKGRLNYKVSPRSVRPLPLPQFRIARVDGAKIYVSSDGGSERVSSDDGSERDQEHRGPQSPPGSPGHRLVFPPQTRNPVLSPEKPSP